MEGCVMSDNNKDPVEGFMAGYGKHMLELEFQHEVGEVETEIEVQVGYESNYYTVEVEPGNQDVTISMSAKEFVEEHLDMDETTALFYFLRDHVIAEGYLTEHDVYPHKAESSTDEEATTVPEVVDTTAAEVVEPEEVVAEQPLSGVALRQDIERLLADEEAVAQVVMAMVNSGFAVSRVK
jgi:hypothetical protein